jgi:hypothetical protein
MRFQLRQSGWPLQGGRSLVPQGTIIDSASPDAWVCTCCELGDHIAAVECSAARSGYLRHNEGGV